MFDLYNTGSPKEVSGELAVMSWLDVHGYAHSNQKRQEQVIPIVFAASAGKIL